jgi:hypothetical protein
MEAINAAHVMPSRGPPPVDDLVADWGKPPHVVQLILRRIGEPLNYRGDKGQPILGWSSFDYPTVLRRVRHSNIAGGDDAA